MTPFAQLGEMRKSATEDDTTARSIARHGINAGGAVAGGLAGGTAAAGAITMAPIMQMLQSGPKSGKAIKPLTNHPKKAILISALIAALGGYGAGRGVNAGIDNAGGPS